MNTYKITLEVDGIEKEAQWSGYTEQVAIAQCFLYEAQNGARSLKVLEIHRIDGECLQCGRRSLLESQGLVCPHE